MSRFALILLSIALPAAFAQTPADSRRPPSLEDLFSEYHIVDASISPSGAHLAIVVRRETNDALMVMDLATGTSKVIEHVTKAAVGRTLALRMNAVYWKSDDRLLFRVAVRPKRGMEWWDLSNAHFMKTGDHIFSIDRDGNKSMQLLKSARSLATEGASLGNIGSFLPDDPRHILIMTSGTNGASLIKTDLVTGEGNVVEQPNRDVVGWLLGVDGMPNARVTFANGKFAWSRKTDGKWVKFLEMREREVRERPDYDWVAPSDQPGKHYVLARPEGHDRVGLYLYDINKEVFGDPVIENPRFDLASAGVSRDGKRVLYTCYLENVRICDFIDPQLNGHMKGLRKYFQGTASVDIYDTSQDGKNLLLYVSGPHDPPGLYYYLTHEKRIEPIGATRAALAKVALPRAEVVSYTARDGLALTGYLTTPAATLPGAKMPLVVYPHGGPQLRDALDFDTWVQYFAARGYAVFQPNFRGSAGFGKGFMDSGHGEWGRKMQDDITDGVKALIDKGAVDPARICIVGASYGGYAALAGAALTPDLYRCAASVAGPADLGEYLEWRRRMWGKESERYAFWVKLIGDPEKDADRLRATSPRQQVAKIKIPVLLIHGTEDHVVPIAQSRAMRRALEDAGRENEFIEMFEEGHSGWWDESEKKALTAIDAFLAKHLSTR